MSREEAMKELSYIIDEMPSMECADWIEAISMAIEALEQEPCGDAISRQAVEDAIYDYSRSCDVDYAQIMEFIDKLPPVTPAEKVGQWIIYDVHGHKACKCSECNNDVGYPCTDKYCKYCGAKMQEVQNDN